MRVLAPSTALLLALIAGGISAAQAQDAADACGKFKWSVAREQQAFAGAKLPEAKSGSLYSGMMAGVTLAMQPQAEVAYPVAPARPPKVSPAYGATLLLPPVAVAGAYHITLSNEAWIDVVQNGKVLRSSGFSGQTGCPGIRKSVQFDLAAGPATIELSNAAQPSINIVVVPAQ